MTREERAAKIKALTEKNDNFNGKFADMTKVQNYRYILNAFAALAETEEKILNVVDAPASVTERWGYVYIDFPTMVYTSGKLQQTIAECAAKADSMVIASLPNFLRLSFGVDVWKE